MAMSTVVTFGTTPLRVHRTHALGVVVDGRADTAPGTVAPYLDPILRDPATREAFWRWIDVEGLVVCQHLDSDPATYRRVGGKRTKGRLSQGEYFHHDGCSTPIKPRVVEIRCPPQPALRTVHTAVVRYPEGVAAMVLTLPDELLRAAVLHDTRDAILAGEPPADDWSVVQGMVNRCLRQLPAESARAVLRDVDEAAGSYIAPWAFAESRFMANDNPARTVQHRRALPPPPTTGLPNGHLLKRWPAEELVGDGTT